MARRVNTARLRKVNDSAKECAEVIAHNVAGRPPKYHPHFVIMIDALGASLVSSTNWQLAKMFGVDETTVSGWMGLHPQFSIAVNRARANVDQQVEGALFQRAVGYTHPEEKIFCAPRSGEIVRARTTMRYPPDTKAAQFWLMNRNPDKWRASREADTAPPSDAADQLRAALHEMDLRTKG